MGLLLGCWAQVASADGVVVLRSADAPPYKAVEASFVTALGQPTRSVALAGTNFKETVKTALATGPSLVFAIGPDAAKTMIEVGGAAPTLFALVSNPGRIGLPPTSPGVSMFASPPSQLQSLKAMMPAAKRVGVLFDPALSAALVADFEAAAAGAGLTLVKQEVASAQAVAGGTRELLSKVDVLLLIPDTTVVGLESFKFIAQTSLEMKVPLVGFSEGMCKAGAVLAVEGSFDEIGKKAALSAKKILAGAAGTREAPEGSVFINAKSAQLLGVAVPPALRTRAAKVFE